MVMIVYSFQLKNITVFGSEMVSRVLLDSTLIFFVEHPQMGKSGEKGKGC